MTSSDPTSGPAARCAATLDAIADRFGSVDDALTGHDEPLDVDAVALLVADACGLSPSAVARALYLHIDRDGFAAG